MVNEPLDRHAHFAPLFRLVPGTRCRLVEDLAEVTCPGCLELVARVREAPASTWETTPVPDCSALAGWLPCGNRP